MALIGLGTVCAVLVKGTFSGAIYIVLLLGIFLAIRLADIEFLDSFGFIVKGVRRPSRRLLLVIVHPLIDFLLISASYVVSYGWFFGGEKGFSATYGYLIFCVPLMMILYASGIYRTYWLRAGINRYHTYFKMLLLGGFCELVLIYVLRRLCIGGFEVAERWLLYGGYVFFFMMVTILVGMERFLVRYLESFGLRSLYLRVQEEEVDEREQHLVLVGGGLACRLFILNLFCRNNMSLPLVVSGIVDDDPALRRLNVYGFPVLGTTEALEELYTNEAFDMLVITTPLADEAMARVREFAKKYPVRLGVFYPETHLCTPDELAKEMERLTPPSKGDGQL